MKVAVALLIITIAMSAGAVPSGTALADVSSSNDLPRPVRFEDEGNSGLITDVWINGSGPYRFAIDTGAGLTIITRRVATQARLSIQRATRPLVGGLSAAKITSNDETRLTHFAIGEEDNLMPASSTAAVVGQLPGAIDGILDPVDAFKPFGFTIDLPNRSITVLDPATSGLRRMKVPRDGAIVKWQREAGSHKPFVKLSDGGLVLLDTGSGFGFVFRADRAPGNMARVQSVSDLGGGVRSEKVAPMTISIDSLELRNVPTDVLHGASVDTPAILGRRALHPFRITFDPVNRLIAIEPAN